MWWVCHKRISKVTKDEVSPVGSWVTKQLVHFLQPNLATMIYPSILQEDPTMIHSNVWIFVIHAKACLIWRLPVAHLFLHEAYQRTNKRTKLWLHPSMPRTGSMLIQRTTYSKKGSAPSQFTHKNKEESGAGQRLHGDHGDHEDRTK